MGIRDAFKLMTTAELIEAGQIADITASVAPIENTTNIFNVFTNTSIARNDAMSVPSLARARNIICGTIGAIPIEVRNKFNGDFVQPPLILNQPDRRIAGSVVYANTAEDLLFFGRSFWQVMDVYKEDGRIREATRIAPDRVEQILNKTNTEIIGFRVDSIQVPLSGVGSLVLFQSYEEGLLARAGRTIKSAIALEKAALNFATEPAPQGILKSNGSNLPQERVQKLLDAWKVARGSRGTAFLNADISYETVGFDPERLQLNSARNYIALEIARAASLPAWYLSAENTSSTYSSVTQERRALIDFSLKPLMRCIEERLSMSDFLPAGQEARFDLDDFYRSDAKERAEIYEILNRIGVMSVEEIREKEDLV